MKFINWIKKTFEDSKGNPSSKRVTGFWITVLFTVSTLCYQFLLWGFSSAKFPINEHTVILLDANYYLCLLLAGFILLLFGVVTFESIVSFIRGPKTNITINENVETKKETTTTDNNEA